MPHSLTRTDLHTLAHTYTLTHAYEHIDIVFSSFFFRALPLLLCIQRATGGVWQEHSLRSIANSFYFDSFKEYTKWIKKIRRKRRRKERIVPSRRTKCHAKLLRYKHERESKINFLCNGRLKTYIRACIQFYPTYYMLYNKHILV